MSRPIPRRRKKTAVARLRPFWFLVLLLFIVATLGAYFLVTWPALRPRAVFVEGNHIVPKIAILDAARIDANINVWLQDTKAMTKRIEAIPYVDTASVHRRPPAAFVIGVTERVPFARLVTADGVVVVDHSLRVLQDAQASFDGLPALVDTAGSKPRLGISITKTPIVALRDDEETLANAHLAASSLEHDKFGDLVVTLHGGVRVLFGDESDLAKKTPLVEPILTQVGKSGRPISAIDLRAPSTPVVIYKQ